MAKKSDLEALHNTYRMFAGQAAAAVRSLSLGSAIDHAIHSLDALPGYANYETRYAKSPHVALPTLAVIFDYSPALFRSDATDCVATLLVITPSCPTSWGGTWPSNSGRAAWLWPQHFGTGTGVRVGRPTPSTDRLTAPEARRAY